MPGACHIYVGMKAAEKGGCAVSSVNERNYNNSFSYFSLMQSCILYKIFAIYQTKESVIHIIVYMLEILFL